MCAGGPQGALTDAPEKAQNFPKRQRSSVNISLFLNPKTGCLPTEAKEGVGAGGQVKEEGAVWGERRQEHILSGK